MQLCPQNCTSRQRSDPEATCSETFRSNPSDSDSKACGRHPVTRSPSAEQRSMLLGHVTTCNFRVIFARRGRDFPEILSFRVTTCNYAPKIARRGREATRSGSQAKHSAVATRREIFCREAFRRDPQRQPGKAFRREATCIKTFPRGNLQRDIQQKPRHANCCEATRHGTWHGTRYGTWPGKPEGLE